MACKLTHLTHALAYKPYEMRSPLEQDYTIAEVLSTFYDSLK